MLIVVYEKELTTEGAEIVKGCLPRMLREVHRLPMMAGRGAIKFVSFSDCPEQQYRADYSQAVYSLSGVRGRF